MITTALLLTRHDGTTYTIMETSDRPNSVLESLQQRAHPNMFAVKNAVTVQRICTDANGIWVYDNPIKIKVTKTDAAPAKRVVRIEGTLKNPWRDRLIGIVGSSEKLYGDDTSSYGLIVTSGDRVDVVAERQVQQCMVGDMVAAILADTKLNLSDITSVQMTENGKVTRTFPKVTATVEETPATPATLKVESV